MATMKVDSSNFQTDVLDAGKPVGLEEISEEMDGVQIAKVNIDENPDLAAQFGVRSIPTLMIFKNGEHADTMIGAAAKSKLVDWIKQSAA
ncbi:thioredoxin [Aureimonas endophytica]|uniref:Thioredoxin n=1 Tax=Aureimonas endophytica TaxID=2027858 RepID=A0A917A153_9HYPH|nr:thioredoxin domain-containing protein [Aureimonas endophytica]GGE21620.1 thioredoxin [Aureimonas endophytica]